MITLSGRGDDVPTPEIGAFLDFAKSLPDACVYERIAAGRLEGRLHRFKTPESFWRRYERMPEFPEGLIPIGDSVAGFNPIFGQGMSVAAVDAEQLKLVLDERAAAGAGLSGLHREVLPKVAETIGEAWEGPATLDYLYESTQGVRPDDYPTRRAIFFAMQEMAEQDEDLRRAQFDVGNMLAPRASLFTADVVARLKEYLENPVDS
jgi:2-polyprenyl-6-methoxyphenol hydroxylase-like FAD-dependent oxidoreductase